MENINKEQVYSFFQLLSKHKIEVPIIQRDYAQGREDKAEIRNNFLSALLLSMDENQPRLKLDFIYGSIVNGSFQPLDGQQRLTTLFLLHWYAAYRDGKLNIENRTILSGFTYETRISSRDFCRALVNSDITTEEVNNSNMSFSDIIINSPWFFLSWKKDPTIKAMLRTIDDIDKKFNKIENLWNTIISDDSPIYFYFVLLEHIGLTDDLYIKMNARGKLLSSFENFKAGLQKHIIDNNWEASSEHKDKFAFKIDTEWADFFWENYRVEDSIDDAFMRFISTNSMIKLSVDKTESDRIGWIRKLQDNHNNIRQSIITKEMYLYVYKCFELYKNRLAELRQYKIKFPLWRHAPHNEGNYLDQIVDMKLTASYSHKIFFYAQTCYLSSNNTINQDKYSEWMRVVRNIISRANIESDGSRPDIVRSPETFDGAINLVTELSKGCSDIYAHLSSDIKITSVFAKNQVEEERVKARLITTDAEFRDIIWKLEDTDLLMGRIEFALFCCDYNSLTTSSIDKTMFICVSNVISKYFGKDTDIDPTLRRALLTIDHNGYYEYYHYWWSYWNVGQADKRCLIDKFRVIEYCIDHQECREYLKKLLIKLCENDSLQEIIDSFTPPSTMPNWQVRLIKEPVHLNSKFSNFIAIPSDKSCCYLLRSKRPRELTGNIKIE